MKIVGPWYFNWRLNQTERLGLASYFIYDFNGGCTLYTPFKTYPFSYIHKAKDFADTLLIECGYNLIDDRIEWERYKVLL